MARVPLPEPSEDGSVHANGDSRNWGASGLAGVWAEFNTRDAIFEAMRNEETFSTRGPHIKMRFFGGAELNKSLIDAEDIVQQAYEKSVPMGSELRLEVEETPSYFVWPSRYPDTYPLQRLQIVKGWFESGVGCIWSGD